MYWPSVPVELFRGTDALREPTFRLKFRVASESRAAACRRHQRLCEESLLVLRTTRALARGLTQPVIVTRTGEAQRDHLEVERSLLEAREPLLAGLEVPA